MDKLCPFRKRTYFMKTYGEQEFNTSSNKAEWTEEEFLPCLGEKCAAHAYQSTIHGNYALHKCNLLDNKLS